MGYIAYSLMFSSFQITLQRLHIILEGFQTYRCDAAERAGTFTLEGLLDLDVARRREFVYLYTQVARRSSRLLLDIGKLGFLGTDEQRHHGKPQLRVQ